MVREVARHLTRRVPRAASADEDARPRKRVRQRNLQCARSMDGARARGTGLEREWVAGAPDFDPGF